MKGVESVLLYAEVSLRFFSLPSVCSKAQTEFKEAECRLCVVCRLDWLSRPAQHLVLTALRQIAAGGQSAGGLGWSECDGRLSLYLARALCT